MATNIYFNKNISTTQANQLIYKVYLWMCFALAITTITALWVATSPEVSISILTNKVLFWGLVIAEIGIVWFLSARINKLNVISAFSAFILYSILNGLTLSVILFAYSQSAISSAFLATTGTFGVMSLYGFLTKRDLSSWGNLLFMALIGLIIASIVNIFFANSTMHWIITYIGIILFIGLTAYDTQRIKHNLQNADINDGTKKIALLGALSLYLNFINMFLYILRLFDRD